MKSVKYWQNKLSSLPHRNIDILIAHSLKKPKEFLFIHPEYQLSIWETIKLQHLLRDYHRGYSVATIIGHKEFFGLNFFVNKNVLIPRPETELMVEEVLKETKNTSDKILLVDVGTGSGCIPISILKNSKNIYTALALDISTKALRVAKKNIDRLLDSHFKTGRMTGCGNDKTARGDNTKIKLIKSNLLAKISNRNYQSFDQIIITANLPYLTDEQVKQEPSIWKEPKIALVAKENGLALYRQLLEQIIKIFTNKKLLILLEIDPSQSEQIKQLAKKYLSQSRLEIKKDLAGLDRILKIST